ncbi:MAG TPA: thioredoxin family protein [Bacillota bacterium]|nr:thioredoxin family protein [Bacillota bacterium]
MIIKILGTGCKKCKMLEENARQAVADLGVSAEIVKVTNLAEISNYVMFTPSLVLDEEVKVEGKVATVEQIKGYLQK